MIPSYFLVFSFILKLLSLSGGVESLSWKREEVDEELLKEKSAGCGVAGGVSSVWDGDPPRCNKEKNPACKCNPTGCSSKRDGISG